MSSNEQLQRAFARACGLRCADESPTIGFTGQSQPPSTIDTIATGLPARPSSARAAVEGGQSSYELPSAVTEALDIWGDAQGDIALAVECALCTWGHDDEMYRSVCRELQSIADAREGAD
jgi:hypothetical protein